MPADTLRVEPTPSIQDLTVVVDALHEEPVLDAVHVRFPAGVREQYLIDVWHADQALAQQACEVITHTLRDLGYAVPASRGLT